MSGIVAPHPLPRGAAPDAPRPWEGDPAEPSRRLGGGATAVPVRYDGGDETGGVRRPGRSDDVDACGLFEAHYPRLAGWVLRLVEDRDTAHDIATEAFTRLLASRRPVDDPRAWLYTVAANLVRDHWRQLGRERRALNRLGTDDEAESEVDVATRVTVRQLVLALPDRLRLPVLLHYYADLPIAQIAEQLNKPEGTIKRALFDARAVLADVLEKPR